jgi:phage-related protein
LGSLKQGEFLGDSLECLRFFPGAARRRAGQQIELLQRGRDPDDWKPIPMVGPGVREIRIRDERGIFRMIYVAKFAEAVFILHCFQKKPQKTSSLGIELAIRRYKALVKGLSS